MAFIDQLKEKHPIRRTDAQKEAFRAWFLQMTEELGYAARVEALEKDSHHNMVVGDPETAQVVFTAHYDTPAGFFLPNFMTPRNLAAFWGYQFVMIAALVLLGCMVGFPVYWLTGVERIGFGAGWLVYMGCLMLMLFGPANKHNVNDNTSGVAAVLETMARIAPENREKAAFILFDNEEKGCKGSKACAKAHPGLKEHAFLVNMDCVGDGENILLLAKKSVRELPVYQALCAAMEKQTGRALHILPLEGGKFNSDQRNFDRGMAVCACKRMKLIGFYVDRIHTWRDVNCDQGNLDFLAEGFARFVSGL